MDKKQSYGDRLRYAGETMFGGVGGLAEIWGVQKEGIYSYFRGDRHPGTELLKKLCDAGLNINWFLTGDGEMSLLYQPSKTKGKAISIPLVANVQCGVPAVEFTSVTDRHIEIDGIKQLLNPFAVVAQGLSMAQTILPGDILVCSEPDGPIADNSVVLVSFKTEPETAVGLVKRVKFLDDGNMILYSDNARNFPPLHVRDNDIFRLYPVYNKFIRSLK